jgi:chromate reductase
MTTKVAVLVGSLRAKSINKQLAQALVKQAHGKLELEIVDIDLPLFNQDLENDLPAKVQAFRDKVQAADAVLFVTPEYNRTLTAALKNAIEWGSRPWGKSIWPGVTGAIVGASQGAIGTAVAQSHLRSVLTHLGVNVLNAPEIYLQHKAELYNADGEIVEESLRKLLLGWVAAFADWIERLRR